MEQVETKVDVLAVMDESQCDAELNSARAAPSLADFADYPSFCAAMAAWRSTQAAARAALARVGGGK